MKKILISSFTLICLTVSLCLSLSSCTTHKYDKEVKESIKMLSEEWEESDIFDIKNDSSKKEIKIINTQVILVDSSPEFEDSRSKTVYNEYFKDIEMIISFEILADFYGDDENYLTFPPLCNEVIFYKDGSKEVSNHYLWEVGSEMYYHDFSDFIECIDLGDRFDRTVKLD